MINCNAHYYYLISIHMLKKYGVCGMSTKLKGSLGQQKKFGISVVAILHL